MKLLTFNLIIKREDIYKSLPNNYPQIILLIELVQSDMLY